MNSQQICKACNAVLILPNISFRVQTELNRKACKFHMETARNALTTSSSHIKITATYFIAVSKNTYEHTNHACLTVECSKRFWYKNIPQRLL